MFHYMSMQLMIFWLIMALQRSSSATVAFLLPCPSIMLEADCRLRLVSSRRKQLNESLLSAAAAEDVAGVRLLVQPVPKIDTAFLDPYHSDIQSWLDSLTSLQRATPHWFTKKNNNESGGGGGVLDASPSQIVQSQLDEMLRNAKPPPSPFASISSSLFSSPQQAAKFDEQWRCSLQSSFSDVVLESVLQQVLPATSNTHLLRLQLVAVPPNCTFALHAHAAIEMAVPLMGQLCERRTSVCLDPAILQRKQQQQQQCINHHSAVVVVPPPTLQELQDLADSLSQRAIFYNHGIPGGFYEERVYPPGCPLMNETGSIHQSFTPCDHGVLFLGLAASIHVHFLPGNFRQRHGIASLKNIEHLIVQ